MCDGEFGPPGAPGGGPYVCVDGGGRGREDDKGDVGGWFSSFYVLKAIRLRGPNKTKQNLKVFNVKACRFSIGRKTEKYTKKNSVTTSKSLSVYEKTNKRITQLRYLQGQSVSFFFFPSVFRRHG